MVKLTAEEWQLYIKSMDCSKVTKAINKRLNDLIRQGRKKIATGNHHPEKIAKAVESDMFYFMKRYEKYGAIDTEPLNVLHKVIRKELPLG